MDILNTLSQPLSERGKAIFEELASAYLKGEISASQLRSCYENTESLDQIMTNYERMVLA